MVKPQVPIANCCGARIAVEAVVSVDERGQLVVPAAVRSRAGIKAGDKLALVACEVDDKVCCLMLVRTEELAKSLKETLGPALQEILK